MGVVMNMFGFPYSATSTGFATSPKMVMASSAPPPSTSIIPRKNNMKVSRNMPPEKAEIFKSMEEWTRKNILPLAKPVEKCWQPQDFLPESSLDGFQEEVNSLKSRAKDLPDDYFVVLVGDMINEETLTSYQSMVNRKDVICDETGVSESPWAIWSRSWAAEENRHSDLLNKYLYLCGRVDMRQVEKTIQSMIKAGMDEGTGKNPYLMFIYSTFQERATFISHGNTARLAKQHGDSTLARICGTIAADEKRHEIAYTNIVEKLFELDPDETVKCFAEMMRRKITMPGSLMQDGRDPQLFQHYSVVAARIGVYSTMEYMAVLEHLVGKWQVEKLTGLSAEGRAAQDFLCGLGARIRKMAERAHERALNTDPIPFSWIYDRKV